MIVCAGTIALDTTHTPFKTVRKALGGSAAYFGVSASHFAKIALVSAVGKDFPEEYWVDLGKRCDLRGVERFGHESFYFESKFDFDMQNRTSHGYNEKFFSQASWLVPQELKNPDFLFLNSHVPAVNEKVFRQAGARMVFTDVIEYLAREQKPFLEKF